MNAFRLLTDDDQPESVLPEGFQEMHVPRAIVARSLRGGGDGDAMVWILLLLLCAVILLRHFQELSVTYPVIRVLSINF